MCEPRRCPQCDAEIPANSPIGLCPRCLLRAGTESQSAASPAEPGPTKLTPPASGFVPPTVEELAPLFPQLEILELLGKGGMGAVYKARQPGLDRLVALKILPPEISRDPAFAERFQREARALARLSHPHIVAVYDFGTTEANGGRQPTGATSGQLNQGADAPRSPNDAALCYIVMEFVDGANLRQTIRTGKLAAAEALAIVPQICEALQFAHDEGIVHRDIKPENILIDKRGRVKIADFGLAKLLGTDASDHSLTATHQVMGTLRYMAPEQMQGSRAVDHRADIYSLGVVFYELLTGELPMGKFAPPSKKVQVDVRLDEVVLRSLEQDPEQRYQHASDVKSEIDTISRTPLPASVARPESSKGVESRPAVSATPFDDSGRATQPRFSRFAIAGAVWVIFGLLTVIPVLYFIGLNRVWNGTALPTDVIHSEPPLVFSIFMGALLAIGAGAPIGTTIFGSLAIGHIKRSDGRVIGWPLAVTDAIFFPLLAVFAGIAVPCAMALRSVLPLQLIAAAVPSAAIAASICFFIARAAWRTLGPQPSVDQRGSTAVTDSKSEAVLTEPRLSRCALVGAIWAPLFFIATVATIVPTTRHTSYGPGEYTGPAGWQLAIMFTLLPLGVLAPFGTTILGAIGITKIKRSGGKLYGLRLAQADALLFPLLLLGAAAFVAVLLLLRGPLRGLPPVSSGLDEWFYLSPHHEFLALLIALPIWFFPARALFRAVVGPRDAFDLRKLPLVGDEPLTGNAALVVALAAIAAHAWPWHWIITPPPSPQRSATISNFDVISALQSFWLLVLSVGLAVFASAGSLTQAAKMILRVGSMIAAGAALVIQAQFYRSLGEWEPSQVDQVARLTRTYSHMGIYVTMALTGLAILFIVLRMFENGSPRSGGRVACPESAKGVGAVANNPESTPFADSGRATHRPKLVPMLATANLIGAIVLMLMCAMEQTPAFAPSGANVWQVWEVVDSVLGFAMAAGMFAASIGLFLWKPWARKLTLGVCVFGLASFVFDAPYLARFAIPDLYAEVQQTITEEGIEPDARDFVAMVTVVVLFAGTMVVGLMWLIGQLVYFTRPRVVAAFAPTNEKPSRFVEWLFTGAGAVVGVLSVFGPLALLLGIASLMDRYDTSSRPLELPPPPSFGTITSGIGAEFRVPAGQVAVLEIVTRRDGQTVPVPPHCGYVIAPSDRRLAATFRWLRAWEQPESNDDDERWNLEIKTAGGGGGFSGGLLLPNDLSKLVGGMSIQMGDLAANEEVIHWLGNANDLPENGLLGLRVTVTAHGLETAGGSGNAHIDWKKAVTDTSVSRRKLPAEETDSAHRAAELGDAARVKQLLEDGTSVNAKDANAQKP